jgi:transcriptional regulator with XRE-family HTH domain
VTNTTGNRFKKIRRDADMTVGAFAAELQMTPTTYLTYEHGDREIPSRLILTLFHKFGVDPIWLLTGAPRIVRSGREYRNQDDWFLSGDLTDADNVKALISQCQRDILEHNFGPEHQLFISTIIETLDRHQMAIATLERERDEARGQLLDRSVEDYKGNQSILSLALFNFNIRVRQTLQARV